jgi:hypothetical protein
MNKLETYDYWSAWYPTGVILVTEGSLRVAYRNSALLLQCLGYELEHLPASYVPYVTVTPTELPACLERCWAKGWPVLIVRVDQQRADTRVTSQSL